MLIDDVGAWVQAFVGSRATVVIANQNGVKPSGDHIVLTDLSAMPKGYPVQTVQATEGDDTTATVISEQFKECAIQFDAYSLDGEALLEDIVCELWLDDTDANICLIDDGSTRNLTALEDTAYLPRYSRDMVFGYSHEHEKTAPTVLTTHVTGDLDEMGFEVGEEPTEE